MAVIYLFDSEKKLKKTIKKVSEIIHREGEYQAEAHITEQDEPEYGDYFGFKAIDGVGFYLFLIVGIDLDDETGECTLMGTDAAAAELDGIVLERISLTNTTTIDALINATEGTEWVVIREGNTNVSQSINTEDAYYQTAWSVIQTVAAAGKVRATPMYEYENGAIVHKYVVVQKREETFSGLIYTRKKGARNIQLTKEGAPYSRVYPIGKVIGDTEPPEQVTIADAIWSVGNGDPTDKPAGQTYVEIPGAKGFAYVYEDKRETDPLKLMEKGFEDLLSRQQWKASGTAILSELSFEMGFLNRNPQIWQRIAIRTEWGAVIEATIVNIERYHVHRELTKITVGEETTLENTLTSMDQLLAETVKAAGGAGAGAGKAKRMVIEAEERIELRTQELVLSFETLREEAATKVQVQELGNQTNVRFESFSRVVDAAGQTATAAKRDVDNLGNTVAGLQTTVQQTAEGLESKAAKQELSELGQLVNTNSTWIQQNAERVRLSALASDVETAFVDIRNNMVTVEALEIQLNGYVKAAQLETTNAKISNLMSGVTKATVLDAALVKGDQATVTYLIASSLKLADNNMQIRTLSMGDVASVRAMVTGATSDVSLEHSHTIEYDEATGKFTLAGVSSSGGSFNIAETQFYKDGVEAAAGLVTFSPLGWVGKQNTVKGSNGKMATVLLPNMTVKTVDAWNSLHKTYARLGYKDTNSSTVEAGWVEVDAGEVYQAGKEAGIQEAGAGYSEGYTQGKADWNPVTLRRETYDADAKTVFVRAVNENDVSLIWANIDASELVDEGMRTGANSVTLSQSGWINGLNTVTASNQRQETVMFPAFRGEVDAWNTLHKTYVRMNYTNANGNTQQAAMVEVDASSVYTQGKADALEEAGGGYADGMMDWKPVLMKRDDYDHDSYEILVRAYNAAETPVIGEWLNVRDVYDLGRVEVTVSAQGWNGRKQVVKASNNIAQATVELPTLQMYTNETLDDIWSSENKAFVYLRMYDDNDQEVALDSLQVDAGSVFARGQNSVTVSADGWVGKQNTVRASSGKAQATVLLPTFYGTVDDWNTLHQTIARLKYKDKNGSETEAGWISVDGSGVYEDGRTNGANSVTLRQSGWINGQNTVTASNTARETVLFPTFQTSVDEWNSLHKTTVRMNYTNANGNVQQAAMATVDGSALFPSALERVDYDAENKLITMRAANQSGDTLIENSIDVWDIYYQGWNDVTVSANGWVGKQNTVKASNGKAQVTVLLPTFYGTVDAWNSLHKTYARLKYKDKNGTEQEAGWIEVDASEIWQAGWDEAVESIEVRGQISEIRNTAPNTFYATGYARALVGDEQVASTTFYKTQEIKVGQS